MHVPQHNQGLMTQQTGPAVWSQGWCSCALQVQSGCKRSDVHLMAAAERPACAGGARRPCSCGCLGWRGSHAPWLRSAPGQPAGSGEQSAAPAPAGAQPGQPAPGRQPGLGCAAAGCCGQCAAGRARAAGQVRPMHASAVLLGSAACACLPVIQPASKHSPPEAVACMECAQCRAPLSSRPAHGTHAQVTPGSSSACSRSTSGCYTVDGGRGCGHGGGRARRGAWQPRPHADAVSGSPQLRTLRRAWLVLYLSASRVQHAPLHVPHPRSPPCLASSWLKGVYSPLATPASLPCPAAGLSSTQLSQLRAAAGQWKALDALLRPGLLRSLACCPDLAELLAEAGQHCLLARLLPQVPP